MSAKTYNPVQKKWVGAKIPPMYNTSASLGYLILECLKINPQHVIQINADTGLETRGHTMRSRTIKIAKSLTKLGFKQSDMVVMMCKNSEYLSALTFACVVLGMPANFLSPTFNRSDIVHMIGITKPRLVICDAEFLELMESALEERNHSSTIFTTIEKISGYQFVEDLICGSSEDDRSFV